MITGSSDVTVPTAAGARARDSSSAMSAAVAGSTDAGSSDSTSAAAHTCPRLARATVALKAARWAPHVMRLWKFSRFRVCVPPPQDLLHCEKDPHGETRQTTGIAVHCDSPAFSDVQWPGGHGAQGSALPGAEMNWPEAQLTHWVLPSACWNLPAGQCRQCRWPEASTVWKRPLEQSVHSERPVASAYLPAGHDLHTLNPMSSENRSTAHGAHASTAPA